MSQGETGEGLVLSDVRAGYGETTVIDGVSLHLAPGSTMALLGRNGVGKTTLFATIMGHTRQHGGEIRFNGTDITRFAPYLRARKGLALAPQEREIFKSLTVEENLTVAAREGRWTLPRIYEFFPRLAERHRNRGDQLSGGEQQMLTIGRALMGNPTFLLLDEPMEGLAPVIVDAVLAGLHRLRQEDDMAILLVEQHARLALEFADDALVLDRGKVVYTGAAKALLASPQTMANLLGVAGRVAAP